MELVCTVACCSLLSNVDSSSSCDNPLLDVDFEELALTGKFPSLFKGFFPSFPICAKNAGSRINGDPAFNL